MTVWFLNQSAFVRLSIVAFLGLVVVAIATFMVAFPLAVISAKERELTDARGLLGRYQFALKADSSTSSIVENTSDLSRLTMIAASEAVAQADLQERLNAVAERTSTTVLSVSPAPVREQEGVSYVALRVTVSGTLRGIQDTVSQLEGSLPLVFIDGAKFIVSVQRSGRNVREPMLQARLTIRSAFELVADGVSNDG